MTIKSFIFVLLLCISGILQASNIPQYKINTVQKIFNDLKSAKGIFPHEEPKLVFHDVFPGRGNLVFAYIDYDKSEIHLEEEIYNVCVAKLGADSLNGIAFMLGHELAHFLNRHKSVGHHIPKDNESLIGDKVLMDILRGRIENIDESMEKIISTSISQYKKREGEATADLEGGFITYLAGYASDREEPTLPSLFLKEIYEAYEAGDEMRGYPTLEERQAIASSSKVVLDSLIHLYEMGNALASIEHYDEAMRYYEILTRTFESREIYNNMGVNAFLDATKCFKVSDLPTKMPITLDVDSRLGGTGKGTVSIYDDLIRAKKLSTAINYFVKAAQMDSEYPIAHLNLSVTRLLKAISLKSPTNAINLDLIGYQNQILLAKAAAIQAEMDAKSLIEKLNNFPSEKQKMNTILSNVYIQLASIAQEEKKDSEREAYTIKAMEVDLNNIFIESKNNESNLGDRNSSLCGKRETVNGKDMFDLAIDLDSLELWSTPFEIKNIKDEKQTFKKYEDDEYKAYLHEAEFNNGESSGIWMFYLKGTDVSSVCDIHIGSFMDDLKTSYGPPVKFFAVTGGSYVVYDTKETDVNYGVVFFLDNTNHVKSWFSYLKTKN